MDAGGFRPYIGRRTSRPVPGQVGASITPSACLLALRRLRRYGQNWSFCGRLTSRLTAVRLVVVRLSLTVTGNQHETGKVRPTKWGGWHTARNGRSRATSRIACSWQEPISYPSARVYADRPASLGAGTSDRFTAWHPYRTNESALPASDRCGELGTGGDPQFGQCVRDVGLHRGAPHEQPLGDLGIRPPFGKERADLNLGWGETVPSADRKSVV